eukprot:Sspe_Gene.52462::Locus_29061_Transcript_1_1_Confidence_1.000_Length_6282::g.52462::m.52462/K22128/PIEZO1_2, FAM38; piezo-type mechanosensitive ion channel component 1/2
MSVSSAADAVRTVFREDEMSGLSATSFPHYGTAASEFDDDESESSAETMIPQVRPAVRAAQLVTATACSVRVDLLGVVLLATVLGTVLFPGSFRAHRWLVQTAAALPMLSILVWGSHVAMTETWTTYLPIPEVCVLGTLALLAALPEKDYSPSGYQPPPIVGMALPAVCALSRPSVLTLPLLACFWGRVFRGRAHSPTLFAALALVGVLAAGVSRGALLSVDPPLVSCFSSTWQVIVFGAPGCLSPAVSWAVFHFSAAALAVGYGREVGVPCPVKYNLFLHCTLWGMVLYAMSTHSVSSLAILLAAFLATTTQVGGLHPMVLSTLLLVVGCVTWWWFFTSLGHTTLHGLALAALGVVAASLEQLYYIEAGDFGASYSPSQATRRWAVPQGAVKVLCLLLLIASASLLPSFSRVGILVVSWCFLTVRDEVAKEWWWVLVGAVELTMTYEYFMHWMLPRPTGVVEVLGFLLLLSGLSLALEQWKRFEEGEWWGGGSRYRLSEGWLVAIGLFSILWATVLEDDYSFLSPLGLGLFVVGSWVIPSPSAKGRRVVIVASALLCMVFAAREYWLILSGVSFPSFYGWLCASTAFAFFTTRCSYNTPLVAPSWAPTLFSMVITPAALIFAGVTSAGRYCYGGVTCDIAGWVIGLAYYTLAVYTALPKMHLVATRLLTGSVDSIVTKLAYAKFAVWLSFLFSFAIVLYALAESYHWVGTPSFPVKREATWKANLPHLIVLVSSLIERWTWLQANESPVVGYATLSVWSLDALLASLLLNPAFQFRTVWALLAAVFAMALGWAGWAAVARYAAPIFHTSALVAMVFYLLFIVEFRGECTAVASQSTCTYLDLQPTRGDLVLFAVVVQAVALLWATRTCAPAGEVRESITPVLLAHAAEIDHIRTKAHADLSAVLPITGEVSVRWSHVLDVVPYALLLAVMVDGSHRSTLAAFARIVLGLVLLPMVEDFVWRGNATWRVTYRLYSVLLLAWLVCQIPVVAVIAAPSEYVTGIGANVPAVDRIIVLILLTLLWRMGRVLDSPDWAYMLHHKFASQATANQRGLYIAHTRLVSIEYTYDLATKQHEARRLALQDMEGSKVNLQKVWRRLLWISGGRVDPALAPTPVLRPTPSMLRRNEAVHSYLLHKADVFESLPLATSLSNPPTPTPPRDFRVPQVGVSPYPQETEGGASHTTKEVERAPWIEGLCSWLLQCSYYVDDPIEVMQWLETKGWFLTILWCARSMFLSNVAEVVYGVATVHFLVSPSVHTLLPVASILLYALVSSPRPVPSYWKVAIRYYQLVIAAKAAMIWALEVGWDPSPGTRYFATTVVNWEIPPRTALDTGENMSIFQLVFWELLLFSLLLVHRHALLYIWGLWTDIDVRRAERFLPVHILPNEPTSSPTRQTPAVDKLQIGLWGGVKVEGQVEALGGAAVQASIQGIAHRFPPWLGRWGRRWWRNLFNDHVKLGSDMYAIAFVTDMVAWVVLLVGFSAIMGSNVGLAESIKNNLLPGSLVVALITFFLIMTVDRIVYLTRSLHVKAVLHVILTLVYLLFYTWWSLKFHTDLVVQLFCALKLGYLVLSALQLRNGFPEYSSHHFFAGKYSFAWSVCYTVYRAIPFLYELRMLMDWTFTPTSLKLSHWLRLEDITHELHLTMCDREDTRELEEYTQGKGKPYPWWWKCRSGAGLFCVLAMLLFFPLVWYSSIGPALTQDSIKSATLRVSLASGTMKSTIFTSYFEAPPSSRSLSAEWGRAIELTRPSLRGFGLGGGETRTMQMIPFQSDSTSAWGVSIGALRLILDALSSARTVKLVVSLAVSRPNAPENYKWVDAQQVRNLEASEVASIRNILASWNNRTFPAAVELPDMYTPFAFNHPDTMDYFTSSGLALNRVACLLRLTGKGTLPLSMIFWSIWCDPIFLNGNPPSVNGSGTAGFPFSPEEQQCLAEGESQSTGCSDLLRYDTDGIPRHTYSTPMYFVSVSDLVASSRGIASMIPSLGVVALYTTFVLAVGRIMRMTVTGDAAKIGLTDMEHPECLITIIQYIHMARAERDLELESGLYRELLNLLRSPDLLQQWTAKQQMLQQSESPV